MTTARTDAHRPAALVTEDYEYMFAADTGAPHWAAPLVESGFIKELTNYDPATADRGSNQCHHCGAHLRYVAWLRYVPTGKTIVVGETCLENRFERATVDFQRLRKAAELDRKAQRIVKAVAAFVAENPDLAFMADKTAVISNDFVADVARKLRMYGDLSEKQIAAVRKSVVRDAEYAAKRAAWAERDAAEKLTAIPAPSGTVEVTGEVISTKWHDSDYGTTLKWTVKDDRGFKVWGTVPTGITVNRGDRVAFTANLTVSDRDEFFAFAKRPRKAVVINDVKPVGTIDL
jgi:hypothetical protein